MPKYPLLIVLVIWSTISNAQDETSPSDYTFLERNFFQHYRSEWMMGSTPSFKVRLENSAGGTVREFDAAVTVISLGGIAYEPRLNVYTIADKASISLSVPFDFSGGLSISYPDDAINTGFFAVMTGLFLDANVGNHSTYNNIDMNGYSIGIGYRVFKAPLFGITDRDYKFSRLSSGLSARFMYKKDFRNEVNKLWYVETGFPTSFQDEDIKHVANLYVNFGFGRIINY